MAGLSSFAVLLTTSRALRGKTDAGANVLLAPRESVTILSPQLAVFASHGTLLPEAKDVANAKGTMTLRIEIYVPMEMKVAGPNGSVLDMSSSASGELVLSALWNDSLRTLQTDPQPWSVLWRDFVMSVRKFDFSSNLFETKEGGRIAMRGIEMQCETLSEPIRGMPASGAWENLLTSLTAAGDAESVAISSYLRGKIENNVAGVWQVVSAATGIGVEHLGEIGDGPLQWLDQPHSQR